MDKLKLAEWGERLMTGGAQMGRTIGGKVKEILQVSTLESKMVDEATLETMEEPNWGMNMRICSMINSDEFNGNEVMKAIKRKISGKNEVSQRLSLELLEACAMNCEKVFSEVASEKVLDEMVTIIKNPETDHWNRNRAWQLLRVWGESEDLTYLPVFRQTYMSLKGETVHSSVEDVDSPPMQHSLESYLNQEPVTLPARNPNLDQDTHGADNRMLAYDFGNLSIEEKNENIVVTRNSLELLSSMLENDAETKPIKDDLTVSLLDKCKQSQPVIQMIISSTIDDEGLLFEALNLNDELQRVISRFEELDHASLENPEGQSSEQPPDDAPKSSDQLPENSHSAARSDSRSQVETANENKEEVHSKTGNESLGSSGTDK